jgi:hypothetical protein
MKILKNKISLFKESITRRQMLEDHQFEARLGYIVKLCLKKKTKNKPKHPSKNRKAYILVDY